MIIKPHFCRPRFFAFTVDPRATGPFLWNTGLLGSKIVSFAAHEANILARSPPAN